MDRVSKSSLTLFRADRQTHNIPQMTGRVGGERERKLYTLAFQMQLSAPYGSIVILVGSRLFWNVCEAQWATESTFTLTHACCVINLAAAGAGGALAHISATRQTN